MAKKTIKKQKAKKSTLRFLVFGVACIIISGTVALSISKLWSEICQKVGYMNIVDYDNFGDIKSIFYDLEKRHLIKKENDGIE